MIKFIAAMAFAILTVIPNIYVLFSYEGAIKDDDKKLATTVYKMDSISLDAIETKLQKVEKFDITKYH